MCMKLTMGTHPSLGNFLETHPTQPVLIVQISPALSFYSVCFPSGLLWIRCRLSLVDPSLHRASPALTLQTAKRIMWLWWVWRWKTAHCILSFNDLRHVNTPCVSEVTLSPLAEPSVYLPSRKWHQQPGPQKMWECGLPCTGLPAWITQPT